MATLKSVIDDRKVIYFGDVKLSELAFDQELCLQIQKNLYLLGYYNYKLDGLFGNITRAALQDFIETENLSRDYILDATVASFLLERASFGIVFDENVSETEASEEPPQRTREERTSILGTEFGDDKDSFKTAVIKACLKHGLPLKTQMAYVLATAEHETNATYKPVREAYWLSEAYRKKNFWYYPYYGRGYVQLTHDFNYEKYGKILGLDLLNEPDQVMEPTISLFVLVHGMATGGFTGKRLGLFVNASDTDFVRARSVVNGKDKRRHIARLAERWLERLLDDDIFSSEDGLPSFSQGKPGQDDIDSDLLTREFKRSF